MNVSKKYKIGSTAYFYENVSLEEGSSSTSRNKKVGESTNVIVGTDKRVGNAALKVEKWNNS